MEFHEIANVFPMLDDDELEQLADDIVVNGQIRPIMLFEGKILDGRNRFLACQKAKVKPGYTTFVGDFYAAVRYATSENVLRRHLTESQRAWVANKIANLKPGRPKETGAIAPVTQAKAAQQLAVSPDSVKRARQVELHGVPELGNAVASGDIRVSAAAKLAKLPPEQQSEALAGGKEKVREAIAELGAPVRRTELSEAEVAIRRQQATGKAVDRLAQAVLQVKQVVQQFSQDSVAITPDAQELATEFVAELRTAADWLETIIGGLGVPDSVPASWLLEDGNGE